MPQRMPEAEVSLRLAFWLIQNHRVSGNVSVAIPSLNVTETLLAVTLWLKVGDSRDKRGGDFRVFRDIEAEFIGNTAAEKAIRCGIAGVPETSRFLGIVIRELHLVD